MIIPMLCVTIFVILVVWFLLPRVARLMIHTPTAISIFVCMSMVQLMAVFISRSEERRVGKECRFRWRVYHWRKEVEHGLGNLLARRVCYITSLYAFASIA